MAIEELEEVREETKKLKETIKHLDSKLQNSGSSILEKVNLQNTLLLNLFSKFFHLYLNDLV